MIESGSVQSIAGEGTEPLRRDAFQARSFGEAGQGIGGLVSDARDLVFVPRPGLDHDHPASRFDPFAAGLVALDHHSQVAVRSLGEALPGLPGKALGRAAIAGLDDLQVAKDARPSYIGSRGFATRRGVVRGQGLEPKRVSHHVVGDAQQQRCGGVGGEAQALALSPCLEKDGCRGIFGHLCAAGPPQAVALHRPRVCLIELSERVGIAASRALPQLLVGRHLLLIAASWYSVPELSDGAAGKIIVTAVNLDE